MRYLVAGGLAVVAHGHARFTKDVDLVVQLVPEDETTSVRFVSIPALIRMKEAARRPQDHIDIEFLKIRLADEEREEKGS